MISRSVNSSYCLSISAALVVQYRIGLEKKMSGEFEMIWKEPIVAIFFLYYGSIWAEEERETIKIFSQDSLLPDQGYKPGIFEIKYATVQILEQEFCFNTG